MTCFNLMLLFVKLLILCRGELSPLTLGCLSIQSFFVKTGIYTYCSNRLNTDICVLLISIGEIIFIKTLDGQSSRVFL